MRACVKTICLSKRHDSDLISLLNQVGISTFNLFVKDALRLLVRPGYEPEAIGKKVVFAKDFGQASEGFVRARFSLSTRKDGDVIALLSAVKSNKTGAFVKSALRLALGPYYSLGYYLKGNEALCDAYAGRGLFFVETMGRATEMTVSAPSKHSVKKKPVKRANTEISAKEDVAANDSIKETVAVKVEVPTITPPQPVFTETHDTNTYEEPETSGSASADLSEDDILALLENM